MIKNIEINLDPAIPEKRGVKVGNIVTRKEDKKGLYLLVRYSDDRYNIMALQTDNFRFAHLVRYPHKKLDRHTVDSLYETVIPRERLEIIINKL